MALSLAGLFASLTGCPKSVEQERAVAANPPPKPPNCPDLPELANLRLKDGSLADVRIFRDGDETFYVPFSWFQHWLKLHGHTPKRRNPNFRPDVEMIECPGVVHAGQFNFATPAVPLTKRFEITGLVPPNFSTDSEIEKIMFRHIDLRDSNPEFENTNLILSNGFATVRVRMSKGIVATYKFFPLNEELRASPRGGGPTWEAYVSAAMASEKFNTWRGSVGEFYAWLKTPPKDRYNDRIFKLGYGGSALNSTALPGSGR